MQTDARQTERLGVDNVLRSPGNGDFAAIGHGHIVVVDWL